MVIHILADGTITKDITGHIVKYKEAENLYSLMSRMKVKKNKKKEAV